MATTMTVQCPSCDTSFPVDPDKVPETGVRTQCTICETIFRVDRPVEEAWETESPAAAVAQEVAVESVEAPPEAEAPVEVDAPAEAEAPAEVEAPAEAEAPEEVEALAEVDEPAEAGAPAVVEFPAEPEVEAEAETAFEVAPEEPVGEAEADAELEVAPEPGFSPEPEPSYEAEVPELTDEAFVSDAGGELVPDADEDSLPTLDTAFGSEWSTEGGDDWVVESEERPDAFGEVEVERLDTVEEHVRSIQDEELPTEEGISQTLVPEVEESGGDETMEGFMTADEVMLTDMDLDVTAGDAADAAAEGGDMGADSLMEPIAEADTTLDEISVPAAEAAPADATPAPEVTPDATVTPEPEPTPEPAPAPTPEPAPAPEPQQPSGFQFGRRDPHDKARRLARVLVSDMITYNPDRHNQALEAGTLKADFEEEIEKSWAEYVEQVGKEMAESTTYWTDALNEILAKGQPLF